MSSVDWSLQYETAFNPAALYQLIQHPTTISLIRVQLILQMHTICYFALYSFFFSFFKRLWFHNSIWILTSSLDLGWWFDKYYLRGPRSLITLLWKPDKWVLMRNDMQVSSPLRRDDRMPCPQGCSSFPQVNVYLGLSRRSSYWQIKLFTNGLG